MAIQLAKLAGLTVLATASRQESTDWVKQLGADHVLNHRQPLRPQLEAVGLKTVDYILNCADTDGYWDVMADLIAALRARFARLSKTKGAESTVHELKARPMSGS